MGAQLLTPSSPIPRDVKCTDGSHLAHLVASDSGDQTEAITRASLIYLRDSPAGNWKVDFVPPLGLTWVKTNEQSQIWLGKGV